MPLPARAGKRPDSTSFRIPLNSSAPQALLYCMTTQLHKKLHIAKQKIVPAVQSMTTQITNKTAVCEQSDCQSLHIKLT